MQLVLERSVSIAQAARRYGRHERAIRHWCWVAPISVRVAGGSRRVSLPLADLYAAGAHQELWDLLDGDVAPIVADFLCHLQHERGAGQLREESWQRWHWRQS